MASLRHYLRLLDRIHRTLLPKTYLEIGVANGRSLALALPGTTSIGVDPTPRVRFAVDPSAQVFAETSDDFFARHDVRALLDGAAIDLAFIDGMHRFEFALRDFINVEKLSHGDTTVLIHDCLPRDGASATREPNPNVREWAGDTWKLILCLREARPDLEVTTVDVAPTGLGIVRGLDPTSSTLRSQYDDLLARYLDLSFDAVAGTRVERLNPVPDEWSAILPLLPAFPYRSAEPRLLQLQRARRLPALDQLPGEMQRRLALTDVGARLATARRLRRAG